MAKNRARTPTTSTYADRCGLFSPAPGVLLKLFVVLVIGPLDGKPIVFVQPPPKIDLPTTFATKRHRLAVIDVEGSLANRAFSRGHRSIDLKSKLRATLLATD